MSPALTFSPFKPPHVSDPICPPSPFLTKLMINEAQSLLPQGQGWHVLASPPLPVPLSRAQLLCLTLLCSLSPHPASSCPRGALGVFLTSLQLLLPLHIQEGNCSLHQVRKVF